MWILRKQTPIWPNALPGHGLLLPFAYAKATNPGCSPFRTDPSTSKPPRRVEQTWNNSGPITGTQGSDRPDDVILV